MISPVVNPREVAAWPTMAARSPRTRSILLRATTSGLPRPAISAYSVCSGPRMPCVASKSRTIRSACRAAPNARSRSSLPLGPAASAPGVSTMANSPASALRAAVVVPGIALTALRSARERTSWLYRVDFPELAGPRITTLCFLPVVSRRWEMARSIRPRQPFMSAGRASRARLRSNVESSPRRAGGTLGNGFTGSLMASF